MGTHKPLGQCSVLHSLPTDLFLYILNFFASSSTPKLLDLGSTLGTYLTLGASETVFLAAGMKFIIGGCTSICIDSIQNPTCRSVSSEVSSEESGTNIMD